MFIFDHFSIRYIFNAQTLNTKLFNIYVQLLEFIVYSVFEHVNCFYYFLVYGHT
jgi:hypothetical protein